MLSQCGFSPKIAILGLNPHNAELRKNSEERKIIIPSINHLKKVGINLKGPYSADTIFLNEYVGIVLINNTETAIKKIGTNKS